MEYAISLKMVFTCDDNLPFGYVYMDMVFTLSSVVLRLVEIYKNLNVPDFIGFPMHRPIPHLILYRYKFVFLVRNIMKLQREIYIG